MTPDLRFPHQSELDPQTQWDTFKAQLSYVLAFPESELPDEMDLPEMIDFFGATPINISLAQFAEKFYKMTSDEILGDELTIIKIKSTENTKVENLELISLLHSLLKIGENTEVKPIQIFFLEADISTTQETYSSAAMIIPIEIESDYLVVQTVPMQGSKEPQDPVLRELQRYWTGRTKIENMKRTKAELLKIKGITRGSDLKKR